MTRLRSSIPTADRTDHRNSANVVTLPSSIRAHSGLPVPKEISRAMALAVWDGVLAEDPSFFDEYPREGRTGSFGEDERVGIIREILGVRREDIEPSVTVRPSGDIRRHQLVRSVAMMVMGVAPRGAMITPSRAHRSAATSAETMLEAMMSLGTHASALPDDLDTALDEARERWSGGVFPVSTDDHVFRSMLDGCRTWARCGFPRVVLGSHRLAASMMWVDATKRIEDLAAPWEAFWISIPNNLVRCVSAGRETDITDGFVHVSSSGAVIAHFGDSREQFFQLLRPSIAALGRPDEIPDDWADRHADAAILTKLVAAVEPPTESGTAAAEMLANLVHSVCVDMTAHRPSPRTRSGGRVGKTAARDGSTTTDYVVERRAVYVDDPDAEEVNCIGVVRDYVRDPTRSRTATTQRIHRAHYQMQVHGPRGSLRRLQLHRAYRQGPEDAPIAVRPHVRREKK